MIQFNLLPDVKIEYIKARRAKRLVILGSTVVASLSVAILLVLFLAVNLVQRDHLNDLKTSIRTESKKLQDTPDLNKILTVQKQLNSLDTAHDQKPAIERVGPFISQVTPAEVSFGSLKFDYTAQTITIEGGSSAVKWVNEFADTMKFTTYKLDGEEKNAFPSVVLAAINRNDNNEDKPPVTFQLVVAFDPTIFNITKTIKLDVPRKTTTRSILERPSPVFKAQDPVQADDQGAQDQNHTEEGN